MPIGSAAQLDHRIGAEDLADSGTEPVAARVALGAAGSERPVPFVEPKRLDGHRTTRRVTALP